MIRHLILCSLLVCPGALLAETAPDLLRFTNGDRLHGHYTGFKNAEEILWKRDDITEAVPFKTKNLRQLIVRGGNSKPLGESLSYIELINGDQIPGTVTGIDETSVTIESLCSGTLKIPRNAVTLIAPNPLGGPISYHGPFSPDGWEMIHPKHPNGIPELEDTEKKEDQDKSKPGRWAFSGSAWYWQDSRIGTALVRKNCMPSHSIVRFKLAWKNELRVAIALHADSSPIPVDKDDKDDDHKQRVASLSPHDSMMFPHLFGNSYILQLNSNYIVLYQSSINGDKGPEVKRINVDSNRLRLGENSQITVEIRSDREKGNLALYIDEAFVLQWAGIDINLGKDTKNHTDGSGLGFLSQANDSSLKISELVIAEWNGMPDSARNLGVDHRDIAMMTNGLDRYAGEITGMSADNEMILKGKYGTFKLPLTEVAEMRFAKDQLAKPPEQTEGHVSVRLDPIGIISGAAIIGDEKSITVKNPFTDSITLSTEAINMMEFNTKLSTQFDDWNLGL